MNCNQFLSISYTAKEFNLAEIYKQQGPHLELGRACIQKEHRKGAAVISLLWRGITDYMNISGSKILFGCTSIKINTSRDAALIYKFLTDQGSLVDSHLANPTKKYQMPDFDVWSSFFQKGLTEAQVEEASMLIPPLMKSYLKFGDLRDAFK